MPNEPENWTDWSCGIEPAALCTVDVNDEAFMRARAKSRDRRPTIACIGNARG